MMMIAGTFASYNDNWFTLHQERNPKGPIKNAGDIALKFLGRQTYWRPYTPCIVVLLLSTCVFWSFQLWIFEIVLQILFIQSKMTSDFRKPATIKSSNGDQLINTEIMYNLWNTLKNFLCCKTFAAKVLKYSEIRSY